MRLAPLLNLHVGGKVIGTTAEHPFNVKGKGWTPAQELRAGDEIRLMGKGWTTVEGIADSGQIATVYNLEIEGDHTYFVGCAEWGFSVWAHNAYKTLKSEMVEAAIEDAGLTIKRVEGGTRLGNSWGPLGKPSTRSHVESVAQTLESRGWTVTNGGGNFKPGAARLAEEYLPGPGGGSFGSNKIDITAVKDGKILRVNTITTIDGVVPTGEEFISAAQIRSKLKPGEHLLLIPKPIT